MKLYYFAGTVARASLIALCETGAEFEPVKVDFNTAEQQGDDYLKLNPKGRVPVLVDGDRRLTETCAILPYIAARYPDAGLLPTDPWDLARMNELNAYLASTVHVNHAHKMRGHRWATREESFADMRAKVTENIASSMALIENAYLRGPWVLGDAYSVADPYLFVLAGWMDGDGAPLSALPRVADHHARMMERPAVQRALEIEKAV